MESSGWKLRSWVDGEWTKDFACEEKLMILVHTFTPHCFGIYILKIFGSVSKCVLIYLFILCFRWIRVYMVVIIEPEIEPLEEYMLTLFVPPWTGWSSTLFQHTMWIYTIFSRYTCGHGYRTSFKIWWKTVRNNLINLAGMHDIFLLFYLLELAIKLSSSPLFSSLM